MAESLSSEPIRIGFSSPKEKLKAVHGVNLGPVHREGLVDLTDRFREARFPFVRLHDCPLSYRETVDIPCVFPLFHLDPEDERNYRFGRTDAYLKRIVDVGAEVVYRLGVSIQGNPNFRFDTDPPEDPEKWADICCAIIRHYNEGWADGFHFGIRYWEIWNEPDNGPNQWNGTMDEFIDFYICTATRIKKAFPGIQIGGPAFGRTFGGNSRKAVEGFLTRVKAGGAPLDFLSWHVYGDRPGKFREYAILAREVLDTLGYEDAESHLNEWNLQPFNNDWARMRSTPENSREFFEYKNGPAGGAFTASALCDFQDAPLDMTNYYSASTFNYGMFNSYGIPQKPYFVFLAYRRLLDETPYFLPSEGGDVDRGLAVLAGRSEAGDQVQLLVSNFNSERRDWTLTVEGWEEDRPRLEAWAIDKDHDFEPDRGDRIGAESGTLRLKLARHEVLLVRLLRGT